MTSQVQFINILLIYIFAGNNAGNKVDIQYIDSQTDETREITSDVPKCQNNIDASWKIDTANKLQQQSATWKAIP